MLPKDLKMIDELQAALAGLKTKGELKKFLHDLLTEQELLEFSRRWRAAQRLAAKVPYTEIIEETGLSSTTVARVAKWLHGGAGGFRALAKKRKNVKIVKT
ncbi:MAG: YerC/YecD family TrpR-related protein [Candidatus Uhrbacteria bacterium]